MPLQNNNAGALHGVTFDLLSGYTPPEVTPVAGSNPLAEATFNFSKDGSATSTYTTALPSTVRRAKALDDNPILGSHTHALYSPYLGSQTREAVTFTFSKDGSQSTEIANALYPTALRAQRLDDNPILFSHTHALHSAYLAGQERGSATFTFSKDGMFSTTVKDALAPTILRASNLDSNPILFSHTHALHSAYLAGQERGSATFTFSKDGGQTTEVADALAPTQLRASNLEDNPILLSHTHALHSAYIAGQVREVATFTFSRDGGQTTEVKDALPLTVLRAKKLADNPILYSHTHALHGLAGSNPVENGLTYVTGASGGEYTYKTALPPTVRRIAALGNSNPFLATSTHALHGMAGSQQASYQWEDPERFKQHLANLSGTTKGGALHGVAGSQSPGGGGLLGQIGGMMKDLLFGKKGWPLTRYYFYVMIGGIEMAFQGVDGLEAEIGVIDYRDGNSPFFGKDRMPGLVSYSRVTMKKGMFANDIKANNLFKSIAQDRKYTKRHSIFIAMLDHNHIPQFVWRYEKTFITKFVPTNLDAESENEVAVEEIEFVGKAWYTETLMAMAAGAAAGAVGALSGGLNISF